MDFSPSKIYSNVFIELIIHFWFWLEKSMPYVGYSQDLYNIEHSKAKSSLTHFF